MPKHRKSDLLATQNPTFLKPNWLLLVELQRKTPASSQQASHPPRSSKQSRSPTGPVDTLLFLLFGVVLFHVHKYILVSMADNVYCFCCRLLLVFIVFSVYCFYCFVLFYILFCIVFIDLYCFVLFFILFLLVFLPN